MNPGKHNPPESFEPDQSVSSHSSKSNKSGSQNNCSIPKIVLYSKQSQWKDDKVADINTYTGNLHSSTLKDMLEEIEKHMDAKYRMVLDEEIEKRMVQVIKLREDVFER